MVTNRDPIPEGMEAALWFVRVGGGPMIPEGTEATLRFVCVGGGPIEALADETTPLCLE